MKRNVFLYIGVVAFSIVVAYRAILIPITHDEAGTFLAFRSSNIWSCFFNPLCWGNANNHLLNTILLQWSATLFGDEVWAIRLHNVFAGISYFVCAALISARYIKNPYLQVAGLVVLSGHVYLLDFFSLARGYGLMAAGVLWANYGMLRYIEQLNLRWLIFSISMLVLAIFSNFTALLPWAATGAGWLVWLITTRKFELVWKHGLCWVVSAIFLFLLLRLPIATLSKSGEFDWGASNAWVTGTDLLRNLLYGVQYFGENTFTYALLLVLLLAIICLLIALGTSYKEKKLPVLFMMLLLAMNVIVIFLQEIITGAQAPIGRKSIYLIPFIFGIFVVAFGLLRNTGAISFTGIIITLAFVGHLIFTLPVRSCREWYYDKHYPELFSEILPDGPDSDSVRLGATWIFIPALVFYQNTKPLPLAGLKYERPIVIDTTMDFYFLEPPDTVGMFHAGFEIEKMIGSYFLFKRE